MKAFAPFFSLFFTLINRWSTEIWQMANGVTFVEPVIAKWEGDREGGGTIKGTWMTTHLQQLNSSFAL